MGFFDTVKAFARVGAGKAGRAATTTAVKGTHVATDAASKGAASLNKAAGRLRDESEKSEPGASDPDGGSGTTR